MPLLPPCGDAACRDVSDIPAAEVRPTSHLVVLVVFVPVKAVRRMLRWLLKAMG